MPSTFSVGLPSNYKWCAALHRQWVGAAMTNGEWWPRFLPPNATGASDLYLLGIRPTIALTAPTTSVSGTSTAGTYGVCIVYRSTKFNDGLTLDNIQSNRSNIVDVTLAANEAAVLTKVTTADTKVDAIDIYAAQQISSGVYGAFYLVVTGAANSAGTTTFNVQFSNSTGTLIGTATSEGAVAVDGDVLPTDNDFPYANRFALEVEGRLVVAGGIVRRLTCTFTNGSPTVTIGNGDTVADGVYFWNIRRDSDTSGGIDGRGTYLCSAANFTGTSTTVSLIDATGAAANYTGTTGSETCSVWTEPNRRYSKLFNPHAFPSDNVTNDYPSAVLAIAKVPNTSRVLIFGSKYVIAEDYDKLPLAAGLNYISTEWGCSSHFSIVEADGRLYWLDLGKGKRQILMTDGTSVTAVSTQKIKSILDRVTLDENADVWRLEYIHGAYYQQDQTIRWSLYLDSNTSANYVLELDLVTGDVRGDPVFYGHRYMDVFSMANIRGRNLIGQFGWNGGIARIGRDNVPARYRDWTDDSQIAGSVATSGNTTSSIVIASGTLPTSGIGLQGIQVLLWRENDASGVLVISPTYYMCRISANTASEISVNYVEKINAAGEVLSVSSVMDTTFSGSGFQYAIGCIQAILGPKWFSSQKGRKPITFREIDVKLEGQNPLTSGSPIRSFAFENFDKTPRDCQLLEAAVEGVGVSDTTIYAGTFNQPKVNPSTVLGFALHDNSVNLNATALNIEEIVLNYEEPGEEP